MSDPVILEDEDLQTRPPRVQQPVSPSPPEEQPDPAAAENPGGEEPSVTGEATPPEKTPEEIDAELGLPPRERGLAPMPQGDAGFWEIAGAAWQAETIRTDAWNDTVGRRNDLIAEMWAKLPQEARDRVYDERRKAYFAGGWARMADLVADEAGRLASVSPEAAAEWAGYPTSREAFARQIDAGRMAELQEAESVLALPGGGFAEFLGAGGRAMTDPTSLMLLPMGVSGSAWRMILGEAALGALGEAAVLPREYRVAAELGIEDPDPVSRIAMGAAFGGGLAAGLHGLGRGISAFRARAEARRASLHETQPEGADRIDHEAAVDAAEAELRGDQTVQERLGPGKNAETLADIAAGGNRALVVMGNAGATRNQPIDPVLEARLSEAVGAIYGPGYEVRVYSGGQPEAGEGGARTGSVRHDHGRAADVRIYGPDGRQLTGDDLAPLGQFWAARKYGGVGMEMNGGGIHLDIWETPPAGGGMAWNYATQGGQYTPAQRAAIEAGLRGEMPDLRGDAVSNTPGYAYNEDLTLATLIEQESSWRVDAQADTSEARGLGQIVPDTWLELIGKHRPDLAKGRTPTEILALRDDGDLNAEMTRAYMRDNAAVLKANGIDAGPAEIYLAHFMGPVTAARAIGAELDTPISRLMSRKAIEANANVRFNGKAFKDFTAYDLRMWARSKMRKAYTGGTAGDAPAWSGPTSRGYTGSGQVTAGDDFRIDVDWQVVDAASLLRASGDLQPRDRSRIASDAWIADTAARLDPAQLMPSPTADRGTPIVGPDNVIESGNGRFGAIERAYERHPDRAAAYRSAIEGAGFAIPEGVDQPILIARRKTELSPADRARFAIEAQDSGVAVMTPTEMARAHGRAMTAPVLARMDPTQPLRSDANGEFVRSVLQNLPRSARNAMYGADGLLNAAGERQLREAIFARAWPDPDILARFTEGDSGELKSLLEALERAAPAWAALKSDIEAGLVRAEMDISAFVLDAMRMIDGARTLSKREGLPVAKAVQELLDSPDLLDGPIAPLTVALLRKFWKDGRAAKADDVADFLTRYANDARKAGAEGGMFDAPGPREVLRAIDPETFGDLPEDLGRARGFARPGQEAPPEAVADLAGEDFDQGAQSAGADAADAEIVAELRGPSTEERLAEAMASDPTLQEALDAQAKVPLTTDLPGYGTDAFWQQRKYVAADGSEIAGLSGAVEHLTEVSRRLAWSEDGLPPGKIRSERQAVILIGPPASGKSTIANPLARDLGAAIVDVDEAKKLIPEYGRGEGANAVHSESVEITEGVLEEVLAAGDNIVLPKVGGKASSIERTIIDLKDAGYTVRLVEVVAPPEVAIARMVGRAKATGRVIPPEIMREGIDGAPVTYQLLKERGDADGYARIDNTPGLGQPRAVLEDDGEILHAFDGRDRGDRTAQPREAARTTEGQGRDQAGLTAEAEPDPIAAARSDLGEFADIEVELPDGTRVRAGDMLDDLDADRAADEALDTCILDPAATFSRGGGA